MTLRRAAEGAGTEVAAGIEPCGAADSRSFARALHARLLATLAGVVGPAPDCALIDFPDHANVGDSAIWLGEVALLREMRVRARYCCTYNEFSVPRLRKALAPGGLVLIHGGGNFGTLWPHHQHLREQVLAQLRDYRVVQLPQSIHYADDAAAAATAKLIAGHPDFTLLVRDQASLRFGTERLGAQTVLCPDAALALAGALRRTGPGPTVDCFVLARTDQERSTVDLAGDMRRLDHGLSVAIDDWLEEPRSIGTRLSRRLRHQEHSGHLPLPPVVMNAVYEAAARTRLDRGLRMLSQGRVVITDRLHGLILCTAAGIPCVALDNHYGKVSGFHRQWLEGSPLCATATTVPEALDKARRMIR